MNLINLIDSRLVDAQTKLDQLEKRYLAERMTLEARIADLQKAKQVVTPEIQAIVDKLSVVVGGL